MLHGLVAIPMVAGVRLEVELQTVEDPFEGIWVPRERNVLSVRKVIPPNTQLQFGSGAGTRRQPKRRQPKDDDGR